MLELKQLTRVYQRAGSDSFTAVDNVSLQVMHGDFVSIIGKSGSGKSTLMNMIVGLLRPTSGKVLIDGEDLWAMDDKNMAGMRSSKIGYVPQGMSLLSNLTVLDNVRLPFCLADTRGSGIEETMSLLKELGIETLADRYPWQLSGGEMRRTAIARALINDPEILIADEPTCDLDEETTKEVMELFSNIHSRGVTILMVTHEYEITSYGSRLCTMSSGKLMEKKVSR
ncbi:MAG: ABC transporter ATP-binding protein [Bacillota bacterium]|nr:ABC transporter ATP-binding protein [Bacillota bacterium]